MGVGKSAQIVALLRTLKNEAVAAGKDFCAILVCTKPLIKVWEDELSRDRELTRHVYHTELGSKVPGAILKQHDVVLTTYETLMHDWRKLKRVQRSYEWTRDGAAHLWEIVNEEQEAAWASEFPPRSGSIKKVQKLSLDRGEFPLFSIDYKICLGDEAHSFRNKDSFRASSVSDVTCEYRVAITGTPMQNNIWAMYTCIRFLRVPGLCNKQQWKAAFVDQAGKGKDRVTAKRQAMLTLNVMIRAFAIRRMHSDFFENEGVTSLKATTEVTHEVKLSAEMQAKQEKTKDLWHQPTRGVKEANAKAKAKAKKRGKEIDTSGFAQKRKPGELFLDIFRARNDAIHPDLMGACYTEDIGVTDSADLYRALGVQDERDALGVQHEGAADDADNTEAQHALAAAAQEAADKGHLRRFAQEQKEKELEKAQNRNDYMKFLAQQKAHQKLRADFTGLFWATPGRYRSAKITQILAVLRKNIKDERAQEQKLPYGKKRKEHRSRRKHIIYSESLPVLDMLEVAIWQEFGIKCSRYDGTKSAEERNATVAEHEDEVDGKPKDFSDPDVDPSPFEFLLATNKACAEGLSLPHTKYVYFVSYSWNPFNLEQCKGRAIRMTNPNGVQVHYFLCEDSIEIRMRDMSALKRAKVDGVFSRTHIDRNKRSLASLTAEQVVRRLDKGISKVIDLLNPPVTEQPETMMSGPSAENEDGEESDYGPGVEIPETKAEESDYGSEVEIPEMKAEGRTPAERVIKNESEED